MGRGGTVDGEIIRDKQGSGLSTSGSLYSD